MWLRFNAAVVISLHTGINLHLVHEDASKGCITMDLQEMEYMKRVGEIGKMLRQRLGTSTKVHTMA